MKLFVEEAILEPQSGLVTPMQIGSTKVASDTGDISLLILLWEALFFGGQFEQEQYADMVLDSVPVLVDHLDIDRVLGRCKRYRYTPSGAQCPTDHGVLSQVREELPTPG